MKRSFVFSRKIGQADTASRTASRTRPARTGNIPFISYEASPELCGVAIVAAGIVATGGIVAAGGIGSPASAVNVAAGVAVLSALCGFVGQGALGGGGSCFTATDETARSWWR